MKPCCAHFKFHMDTAKMPAVCKGSPTAAALWPPTGTTNGTRDNGTTGQRDNGNGTTGQQNGQYRTHPREDGNKMTAIGCPWLLPMAACRFLCVALRNRWSLQLHTARGWMKHACSTPNGTCGSCAAASAKDNMRIWHLTSLTLTFSEQRAVLMVLPSPAASSACWRHTMFSSMHPRMPIASLLVDMFPQNLGFLWYMPPSVHWGGLPFVAALDSIAGIYWPPCLSWVSLVVQWAVTCWIFGILILGPIAYSSTGVSAICWIHLEGIKLGLQKSMMI